MQKVDRRVRRTRRLFREAFISLVSERGYEAVRIEDILNRADIARTTFYVHFKDKRDLLQHIASTFATQHQKEITALALDESGHFSHAHTVATFKSIKKHAPFFRMVLEGDDVPILYEHAHTIFSNHMQSLLEQTLEQQQLAAQVPTKLAAAQFAGGLLSTARWWLSESLNTFSAEEVAVLFRNLVLQGLLETVGIDIPDNKGN